MSNHPQEGSPDCMSRERNETDAQNTLGSDSDAEATIYSVEPSEPELYDKDGSRTPLTLANCSELRALCLSAEDPKYPWGKSTVDVDDSLGPLQVGLHEPDKFELGRYRLIDELTAYERYLRNTELYRLQLESPSGSAAEASLRLVQQHHSSPPSSPLLTTLQRMGSWPSEAAGAIRRVLSPPPAEETQTEGDGASSHP